ncbi:hypothetical protein PF003_g2164 [Phytophthora fragariae]|nr:hypothetical protein PF003_g2164 [Phytophthora fragariae]
MPPTDSSGDGHRPPDPGGIIGARAADETPRDAAADAQPSSTSTILGGPHQLSNSAVVSLTEFPARVTTPSDAQGGKLSVYQLADAGCRNVRLHDNTRRRHCIHGGAAKLRDSGGTRRLHQI